MGLEELWHFLCQNVGVKEQRITVGCKTTVNTFCEFNVWERVNEFS